LLGASELLREVGPDRGPDEAGNDVLTCDRMSPRCPIWKDMDGSSEPLREKCANVVTRGRMLPTALSACRMKLCLATPILPCKPLAVWRGGHGGERRHAGGSAAGAGSAAAAASLADVVRDGACGGDESLRARVVRRCASRPDLFDVGFSGEGAPLSRRQQETYRVRLLIDAAADDDGGAAGDGARDGRAAGAVGACGGACDKADGGACGGACDSAWRWALTSGSVLVLVGEWVPAIPQLRAWEHFVPVASDLSNLEQRVAWALESADAAAVARRAAELAAELQVAGHATRALAHVVAVAAAAGAAGGGGADEGVVDYVVGVG
jgi:hypothetical protein